MHLEKNHTYATSMVRSVNYNAGEAGESILSRLLMFTVSSTRALDITYLLILTTACLNDFTHHTAASQVALWLLWIMNPTLLDQIRLKCDDEGRGENNPYIYKPVLIKIHKTSNI